MNTVGECKDRIAVVTGAAQGLGLGVAEALAAAGAQVFLTDVQAERVAAEANRLRSSGALVHAATLDVGDSAAVDRFFDELRKGHGRVDIVVNNAGHRQDVKLLIDLSDDEWHRVLHVNLTGTFYVSRAGGRMMARQGSGVIINMSSINGLHAPAMVGAYNAAKAGIISLTKTMASELAAYGVRVNAVCPGPVYTDFNRVVMQQRAETLGIDEDAMVERVRKSIPLGRWGEPSDVASAVVFLCSSRASWITGEILRVSGGLDVVSAVPEKRPFNDMAL